jgi:hypothetical protein
MLNDAGGDCQAVPAAELRLLDATLAQRARAEGTAGSCPSLDGTTSSNLAAGEYLLALRTTAPVAPFSYRLTIEAVVP